MKKEHFFYAKSRKNILISDDFRKILATKNTSLIEQRIVFTTLSAIKDEQSNFIHKKTPLTTKKCFDDTFEEFYNIWSSGGLVSFKLHLNLLNVNSKMRKDAIDKSLNILSDGEWFPIINYNIDLNKTEPFIIDPKREGKFVLFKMSKIVLKTIMDMKHYFSLKANLPYVNSSNKTIKFLLWISKYIKFKQAKKDFPTLLRELYIENENYNKYTFERDFLKVVKADLDANHSTSFDYLWENGGFKFKIYKTESIFLGGNGSKALEKLKIERAIKNLITVRKISDEQSKTIQQFYKDVGYENFSKLIKRKIRSEITGKEYFKALLILLEKCRDT